ncbi:MAG: bifunctional folylpolyglutamate synthase/dihydrofolate synthase [Desulfarculales bacterium]|jgi:dihydrofolate synthase/folylpolyglutamate synthase|nr:bifunctional folylpolyglutamate synthase/dihydrofolate synthase [Desulfarculales bacterium]
MAINNSKVNILTEVLNLGKFGVRLGLDATARLLADLGNPHLNLPLVHLAGTNGKGSTGAMLEAIVREAGYKVIYYTSPHLEKINERFRLNTQPISDGELILWLEKVWAQAGGNYTFFEFLTALAFAWMRHKRREGGLDLGILETGMGGRFDSTNICSPLITVITNVALDHQAYLGSTLTRIAEDKAGIIKPAVPLIHGVSAPGRQIVEEAARAARAPVMGLGREIRLRRGRDGFSLTGPGWAMKNLRTNMPGTHQPANAALAAAAAFALRAHGFNIGPEHVRSGLCQVKWPGRLEKFQLEGIDIWLDGAHNPAAAVVLRKSLAHLRPGALIMVLGIMADKNLSAILKILMPAALRVIFTQPDCQRAAPASCLAAVAKTVKTLRPESDAWLVEADLGKAVQLALNLAQSLKGQILISGSLFTVGAARSWLIKKKAEK